MSDIAEPAAYYTSWITGILLAATHEVATDSREVGLERLVAMGSVEGALVSGAGAATMGFLIYLSCAVGALLLFIFQRLSAYTLHCTQSQQ